MRSLLDEELSASQPASSPDSRQCPRGLAACVRGLAWAATTVDRCTRVGAGVQQREECTCSASENIATSETQKNVTEKFTEQNTTEMKREQPDPLAGADQSRHKPFRLKLRAAWMDGGEDAKNC